MGANKAAQRKRARSRAQAFKDVMARAATEVRDMLQWMPGLPQTLNHLQLDRAILLAAEYNCEQC